MVALQALSVGHAADLGAVASGNVHSVYAHAVNLVVDGELWTITSARRPDLPFGIRVAHDSFDAIALRRGDRVSVRAGFVGIGTAAVIDCRTVPRWTPAAHGAPAPGLQERLGVVSQAARGHAWDASARMADEMVDAVCRRRPMGATVRGVIGRGAGATPAGDDVLVGIFAVLASPHAGPAGAVAAGELWRAMSPLLKGTTELSAHLLGQAARGLLARPLHELVGALCSAAGPVPLDALARRVVDAGATSGADTCMGVIAAARAFLLETTERAAA